MKSIEEIQCFWKKLRKNQELKYENVKFISFMKILETWTHAKNSSR